MGKVHNLTGQTFGTVIIIGCAGSMNPNGDGKRTYWYGECECGQIILANTKQLKGNKTHCDCQRKNNLNDLTGKTFGHLKVLGRGENDNEKPTWRCQCDCGEVKTIRGYQLTKGQKFCSTSCRLNREDNSERRRVHGGTRSRYLGSKNSPEFDAWMNMRHNNSSLVVEEWEDFQQFFKDMGWRPSPQHEIGKHDIREPHGPLNTYWRHPNEEREQRQQLGAADDLICDPSVLLTQCGTAEAVTA